MFPKRISHALLHSKRIHVSCLFACILHVFYTYPIGVQDTFGIHIRYIKIHVSCSLPMCHTGYISGYIRIHVSWNLHRDTSRYKITIHVNVRNTFRIHDGIHVSQMHPERHVSEMQDTCGIHTGSMQDTCILRGNHDTYEIHQRFMCGIHAEYMRNTCGIRVSRVSGGMYRCHHHVQRTYQATHCLLVCKWVFSNPLELPHHLLCHGNPYPCWFTTLVNRSREKRTAFS